MIIDGSKIVRLRREHGWSRNRLAIEAGITGSTMRSVEPVENRPSTAKKLADALGVMVADIAVDTGVAVDYESIAREEAAAAGRMRVSDVAERLGCSTSVVYRMIRDRQIPAAKVSGAWRVRESDLDAFTRSLPAVAS